MSRFTMVARAYKHIRECILTNAKVMSEDHHPAPRSERCNSHTMVSKLALLPAKPKLKAAEGYTQRVQVIDAVDLM